jgi:hypothetical protein
MAFIVQGKNTEDKEHSTKVESQAEAMKKAVELQGEGYRDVKIVANGKAYAPMEFAASGIK